MTQMTPHQLTSAIQVQIVVAKQKIENMQRSVDTWHRNIEREEEMPDNVYKLLSKLSTVLSNFNKL